MPDLGWKLACIKMYIIYNLDFKKSNQFQDEDGTYVQGVQRQTFMFHFALGDRNMQVRFGLKVV